MDTPSFISDLDEAQRVFWREEGAKAQQTLNAFNAFLQSIWTKYDLDPQDVVGEGGRIMKGRTAGAQGAPVPLRGEIE